MSQAIFATDRRIQPFRSTAGQARYLAAYESSLRLWPVPHESLDVTTCYGRTHINACGSKDASPLMLLPGGYASSTMWVPNIVDLSAKFRSHSHKCRFAISSSLSERA